jgi:hypothetical protein
MELAQLVLLVLELEPAVGALVRVSELVPAPLRVHIPNPAVQGAQKMILFRRNLVRNVLVDHHRRTTISRPIICRLNTPSFPVRL